MRSMWYRSEQVARRDQVPAPGWICVAVLALVLTALTGRAQAAPELTALPDLRRHFTGFNGCLVLHQISSAKTLRYNPNFSTRRLSPNSTFNVPNALIALQLGIVLGPDTPLQWDGRKRGTRSWNKDHTLASSLHYSVVWYHQELSRRIGRERMDAALDLLDYGNQDITGGLDRFWLESSLTVSAEEQVRFMRDLMAETLPFVRTHQKTVKDMMILKQTTRFVLHGKTGTGGDGLGGTVTGWFIGALDTNDDRYIFATNLKGAGATGLRARRITEGVLAELGLLQ